MPSEKTWRSTFRIFGIRYAFHLHTIAMRPHLYALLTFYMDPVAGVLMRAGIGGLRLTNGMVGESVLLDWRS